MKDPYRYIRAAASFISVKIYMVFVDDDDNPWEA